MKAKKILSAGGTLLLLAVGVGLLAFGLPTSGFKALSVQTGSMEPGIKPGHLVLVKSVPASQIAIGDVITYSRADKPGQTITHRVTEVRGGHAKPLQFVTKGDANPSVDPTTTPAHRVVGKMVANVPYAGFVADFLRTPLGLALTIYLPALLILIAEIRRLSAHYDSQKPFRLPWVKGTLRQQKPRQPLVIGSKLLALCLIAAPVIAIPTHASLTSNATLTGNSIISTHPASDHLLITSVFLRCKKGDAASTKPQLKLYNPTNQVVNLASWTVVDNQGEIVRFEANARIEPNQTLTKNIKNFNNGLQLAGDQLVLKNAAGTPVDAVSWGSDTSQLNPAAPHLGAGDKLQRVAHTIDTNTAQDWRIKP